jgi:putative membrane protein
MRVRANFGENRLLQILLVWYLVLWVVLAIQPLDRFDWILENLLVVVAVGLMIGTYRFFPLSDLSYILITVFMSLHTVGSHWTYAQVPLGFWIQEAFGFSRNHFDRIAHFSFGLLIAYPIREIFLRVASVRGFWAYYLPFDVTLAFSGAYEIMEWVIAAMVAPGAGDAWLGTQGDIWDAQKDMGLAATGAIISMTATAILRRWYHSKNAEVPKQS